MRASIIATVVWTVLVFWTCAETVHDLQKDGSGSGDEAATLGLFVLAGVWVVGLGAIALLRFLFRR